MALLEPSDEGLRQSCWRPHSVRKESHANNRDEEGERLEQFAVELVAKTLDRQSERERPSEEDASGNGSSDRPSAEDDRSDCDESASTNN